MNNEYNNIEEQELENKDSTKKILLGIFGTMVLVIAVVGVSFAMFYFSMKLSNENSIYTGTISMAFQDTTYIDITNALPMTDEEGMAMSGDKQYMDFSVSANFSSKAKIYYEISAVDETDSNKYAALPYDNVKVYLTGEGSLAKTPTLYSKLPMPTMHNDITGLAMKKDKLLARGSLNYNKGNISKENYRLKMWIDENTEDLEEKKTFKIKVRLDASQKK